MPSPDSPADATRQALIDAALHLFGAQGYAAASTRAIAARAGVNLAAIAYHFGGKEGLREACAEEVARRIAAVALPDHAPPPSGPAARVALQAALARMARFLLTGAASADLVPFMLRELAEGGPGLDRLYTALIGPTHARLCALWQLATGEPAESEAVKLRVFSLVGQLLYFRIGAPVICRRLDWPAIGEAELSAITATLTANLTAALGPLKDA